MFSLHSEGFSGHRATGAYRATKVLNYASPKIFGPKMMPFTLTKLQVHLSRLPEIFNQKLRLLFI